MGTGQTLLVQRGLDIADGQTFTLSDGVRHVVFEYLDTTIPDNQPEPGRLGIPFTPAEPDYVVAQRVRDAINGPDAQAVLDVTASISDGTLIGQGSPMYSTSARVNLFGPVTLVVHATDVAEVNDSIATATPTGIVGLDSASFLGKAYIGDNENFPLRRGFDVDLFRVDLTARETLRIDLDAFEIGSNLDAFVRIFDAERQRGWTRSGCRLPATTGAAPWSMPVATRSWNSCPGSPAPTTSASAASITAMASTTRTTTSPTTRRCRAAASRAAPRASTRSRSRSAGRPMPTTSCTTRTAIPTCSAIKAKS